jgi:beta-glucanase (GH16 family)
MNSKISSNNCSMLRELHNREAAMDRRRMIMAGFGALAAVISTPEATAAPATAGGSYLFHDEFDGRVGSAPDPSKWVVSGHRTPIKNPTGFDRPEFFGEYRDSRQNVFVDGKSNLVLRATRDPNSYFGGLVSGTWRGAIGTTWEARIKLNCLTAGCWPAWWLSNDDPGRSGEVDLMEWYGNGDWPAGTTVHANPDGSPSTQRGIPGASPGIGAASTSGKTSWTARHRTSAFRRPASRISTIRCACGRSTTSATPCFRS